MSPGSILVNWGSARALADWIITHRSEWLTQKGSLRLS